MLYAFTYRSKMGEYIVKLYILYGECNIHKQKLARYTPNFNVFLLEWNSIYKYTY